MGSGDAFSQKMNKVLNYGALNLAMAIGYRAGLFDVMDGFDSPQSVGVIAKMADVHPRYLTEWLGVMASGGIVELTRSAGGENLFFLPKPHADLITRRAGNSNLGVYTQEIPLLTTCALEPVIEGFRSGAGVGYRHYKNFQAFMTELANAKHRQVLVDKFIPSVSGGETLRRLQSGIRVCDLGCGEGLAATLMAEAFPKSRFVGIDISEEALQSARMEAARKRLLNIEFVNLDAANLERKKSYKESFDYVTAFDAIHDQTLPLKVLRGVHSMMKKDALFSMIDIAASSDLAENLSHPLAPFLYTVSLMHCMPVGLVDGGTGLGMMWGREQALKMLAEAGFTRVEVLEIPGDPFNLHFLCRK